MRTKSGISVIGTGKVHAPVDLVELSLGVEVLRTEPAPAFQSAAGSVAAVLGVLADGGVDSRHVRTTDLQLGPRMTYQDNREVVIGYACGQRLIATLEGLSALPRLLTALATTAVEGVRFDGISFSTADPSPHLAQARELAISDARTKASDYAHWAGRELGSITGITELPVGGGGLNPMFERAQLKAADMPVAAGESEIAVTVQVHFAFS